LISQKAADHFWPPDESRPYRRGVFIGATRCFFVSEHNRRLTEDQIGTTLTNAEVVWNPHLAPIDGPIPWPDSADEYLRMACVARLYLLDKGQDIHALVLPSRAEGLPLPLVEAMMCGRPVVVTSVGGNAEVVEEGVTGFLAAPDENSLDAALEKAWARRADLSEMGRLASVRIRELVQADPAKDFADALLEIIDSPGGRKTRSRRDRTGG
jgi:hypothetical protein